MFNKGNSTGEPDSDKEVCAVVGEPEGASRRLDAMLGCCGCPGRDTEDDRDLGSSNGAIRSRPFDLDNEESVSLLGIADPVTLLDFGGGCGSLSTPAFRRTEAFKGSGGANKSSCLAGSVGADDDPLVSGVGSGGRRVGDASADFGGEAPRASNSKFSSSSILFISSAS